MLAETSRWGIEYEPGCRDFDHLTEIAFDLASEGIEAATKKLGELCGCH